jgi:hypothetical protein
MITKDWINYIISINNKIKIIRILLKCLKMSVNGLNHKFE